MKRNKKELEVEVLEKINNLKKELIEVFQEEYEKVKNDDYLAYEPVEYELLSMNQIEKFEEDYPNIDDEITNQFIEVVNKMTKFHRDLYNIERKKQKTILKAMESLL